MAVALVFLWTVCTVFCVAWRSIVLAESTVDFSGVSANKSENDSSSVMPELSMSAERTEDPTSLITSDIEMTVPGLDAGLLLLHLDGHGQFPVCSNGSGSLDLTDIRTICAEAGLDYGGQESEVWNDARHRGRRPPWALMPQARDAFVRVAFDQREKMYCSSLMTVRCKPREIPTPATAATEDPMNQQKLVNISSGSTRTPTLSKDKRVLSTAGRLELSDFDKGYLQLVVEGCEPFPVCSQTVLSSDEEVRLCSGLDSQALTTFENRSIAWSNAQIGKSRPEWAAVRRNGSTFQVVSFEERRGFGCHSLLRGSCQRTSLRQGTPTTSSNSSKGSVQVDQASLSKESCSPWIENWRSLTVLVILCIVLTFIVLCLLLLVYKSVKLRKENEARKNWSPSVTPRQYMDLQANALSFRNRANANNKPAKPPRPELKEKDTTLSKVRLSTPFLSVKNLNTLSTNQPCNIPVELLGKKFQPASHSRSTGDLAVTPAPERERGISFLSMDAELEASMT